MTIHCKGQRLRNTSKGRNAAWVLKIFRLRCTREKIFLIANLSLNTAIKARVQTIFMETNGLVPRREAWSVLRNGFSHLSPGTSALCHALDICRHVRLSQASYNGGVKLLQTEEETEAKRGQSDQQRSKGLDLKVVCRSRRPDVSHHAFRLDSHRFLGLPHASSSFVRDIDLTCDAVDHAACWPDTLNGTFTCCTVIATVSLASLPVPSHHFFFVAGTLKILSRHIWWAQHNTVVYIHYSVVRFPGLLHLPTSCKFVP